MFPEHHWKADLANSGTITVKTPASGKYLKVGMIEFTVDADATVTIFWDSDSADNRILNLKLKAGWGVSRESRFWKAGPKDGVLKITASAGNLTGTIAGWELP